MSGKLAAIYVRVSTERQGDKASPDEQEADCRKLAQDRGLIVVEVYRDIERYRSKGHLVEPSGSRADRPGLLAMLRNAEAERFSVILAWTEDRLYRSLRVMLNVLETVKTHNLSIMLAREQFDPNLAWLKAGMAEMWLTEHRERVLMGSRARLRSGRAITGYDRYGYRRNGETIEVLEDEARWVHAIFGWYLEGLSFLEMRQRLIEAGAPQKSDGGRRMWNKKAQWSIRAIQAILVGAREYASGIKIHTMGGEAFEIPVPPIIDVDTWHRADALREAKKTHPNRNQKTDYLIGGLLYCQCGRKWSARCNPAYYRNKSGKLVERRTRTGYYICTQRLKELRHPDCPQVIGSGKADQFVWNRVCEVLRNPDALLAQTRRYIDSLREEAESLQADSKRMQDQLDTLALERQRVIGFARKGLISEGDLDYQLGALTLQEAGLRRELIDAGEIARLAVPENWEQAAQEHLARLGEGLDVLNSPPANDEERRQNYADKRAIVLALVERVNVIGKDRHLTVVFRMDVRTFLAQSVAVKAEGVICAV